MITILITTPNEIEDKKHLCKLILAHGIKQNVGSASRQSSREFSVTKLALKHITFVLKRIQQTSFTAWEQGIHRNMPKT